MVRIKSKSGLAMINKTLFAIFLVLFVFFMFFTVTKSRVENKSEKLYFDQYEFTNKFLLSFLSNPNCLSIGSEINGEKHTTVQGVLDVRKLNKFDRDNEDMWCVENFDFLYSVNVLDTQNKKTWRLGILNPDPFWSERTIGVSLPGIVRYEDGTGHLAQIGMNAYFGEIAKFIGEIKRSCLLKRKNNFEFNTKYKIKYSSENNLLNIDTDNFYPYFSCHVNDFEIEKGTHPVFLSAKEENVSVLI
ncbi:hypothetical protein HN827_09215 [archaeon]|nr:hypothetical protein [archaeon]